MRVVRNNTIRMSPSHTVGLELNGVKETEAIKKVSPSHAVGLERLQQVPCNRCEYLQVTIPHSGLGTLIMNGFMYLDVLSLSHTVGLEQQSLLHHRTNTSVTIPHSGLRTISKERMGMPS